jgi:flagellar basal body-associated protein FliL
MEQEQTEEIEPQKKKKWPYLVLLFLSILVLLFAGGLLAGYFFFGKWHVKTPETEETGGMAGYPDYFRIYYPANGHLEMEERKAALVTSGAEDAARAVMDEFLKGPVAMEASYIPMNAKLLDVYSGTDGTLYVDLSEEFRRNFQGDALSEFLLLRGIYESLLSNVQGITDVKILVDGKEVESIGGHVLADLPLGQIVITKQNAPPVGEPPEGEEPNEKS